MKKLGHPARISGRIILAGNPNVGKSTLFNHITGMRVHTGNWSGKTVTVSEGYGVHNNRKFLIQDLPGISSLSHPDAEELAAFEAIIKGDYDCCVIVLDATNLSRSLSLALRIIEITPDCVLCVNLCDEAKKKGITIDAHSLEFILGIPVVLCSAGKGKGIKELLDGCERVITSPSPVRFTPLYPPFVEDYLASLAKDRTSAVAALYFSPPEEKIASEVSRTIANLANKIANLTSKATLPPNECRIDKILCSPLFGIPAILLLLGSLLYITIVLSNYPSSLLSALFAKGGELLTRTLAPLPLPPFLTSLIIHGIYSTTTTVIAVMLPPMAIFFPLFTLLEDFGFLPRVAFNLDNAFKKCGSCGKQALTMCMGLGCNCVGITGSAIIPSKREKLISIVTNSFTPCNGRFGALLAVIALFFAGENSAMAALFMVGMLAFSTIISLTASFVLSKTLLRGEKASFILEIPPFRRPRIIPVIVRSLFERTFSVLFRAVIVAAPIGAVIFTLNYFKLLFPIASFLHPFATLMGLDGVILLSFILALPANEIVFPIMLMLYTGSAFMTDYTSLYSLKQILLQNNWSAATAMSFIIFTLFHWPCITALLTAKKETGSLFWTAVSFVFPMLFGIFLCIISNALFSLFAV